ncbi:MAG: hypothetical protein JOZ53_23365 [Planctomycetaceae bacterium]|nr:hypothetical protein [Planctomycetaceae bacterium]
MLSDIDRTKLEDARASEREAIAAAFRDSLDYEKVVEARRTQRNATRRARYAVRKREGDLA